MKERCRHNIMNIISDITIQCDYCHKLWMRNNQGQFISTPRTGEVRR